nr:male-specific transformer variant 1 [Zeugodacus tau]UTQ10576.1 male-specific transformer variant 2 [Zeugodacus tau]UTQ10577.1 male-specific transformer variant 1 [Zeugodacus tau]UTQ10579.1 male-specific transformer variant 2 [Zeugodacus tau]
MNLNIPKPLATTSKIQIKQHVPIGSIRKGPHAIERSLVPDEVVIKRRFGNFNYLLNLKKLKNVIRY